MKLKVTDWKHAWFESHISDRFFQEMSKLDHGAIHGLETSAQWMEQIMIEVGLLAQAMIRLEQSGAPEPQIRQAYEKSMRLAALAMQLITALDGADREQLRSAALVRGEHGGAAPSQAALPAPLPAFPTPPQLAAPAPAPAASAAGGNPALAGHPVGQAGGTSAAIAALTRGAQGVRPPPPAPRAERKTAAVATESAAPAPAPAVNSNAPVFSSLLQISGRNAPRSESYVHQTILSLSEQGLSRAEIEMVTGEPRHIIEAVLNHHRTQQQAGASPS